GNSDGETHSREDGERAERDDPRPAETMHDAVAERAAEKHHQRIGRESARRGAMSHADVNAEIERAPVVDSRLRENRQERDRSQRYEPWLGQREECSPRVFVARPDLEARRERNGERGEGLDAELHGCARPATDEETAEG